MIDYTVTVTALDAGDNEWTADYAVTVLEDGVRDTRDEPGYDPDLELELLGAACDDQEVERGDAGVVLDALGDKAYDAALAYYWRNYWTEDE